MSLSSGDWVRIQRLKKAVDYPTVLLKDKDITNVETPPGCPAGSSVWPHTKQDSSRQVGSSKTRREITKWTDYIAARRQDWISTSDGIVCEGTSSKGIRRIRNTLCGECSVVFNTKVGNCSCSDGKVGQNLRML